MELFKGILEATPAILAFGFIGVSALFVILAFINIRTVSAKPNPPQAVVDLSRFFMKMAIIFMVAAAPLHWGTLYIDSLVNKKSAKIYINMDHATWKDEFGEVYLKYKDKRYSLVNQAYSAIHNDEDSISITAEEVMEAFQRVQLQVAALNRDLQTRARSNGDPSRPVPALPTSNVDLDP